jgi:hypothetical protein
MPVKGDFLSTIWHGIKLSGCTLLDGCPTDDEEKQLDEADLAERAAGARLMLIHAGFSSATVAGLTDQQVVDISNACSHG